MKPKFRKWIDVNEKLPCPMVDVFLLCVSKDRSFSSVVVGSLLDRGHQDFLQKNNNEKISCFAIKEFATDIKMVRTYGEIPSPFDEGCFFLGEITHWLKMPKLPKLGLINDET